MSPCGRLRTYTREGCRCDLCRTTYLAYLTRYRNDKTAEGLCYKCGRIELRYRTCRRCRVLAAAGKKRRAETPA